MTKILKTLDELPLDNFKVIILDFDGVITLLGLDWFKLKLKVSKLIGKRILSFALLFETKFGTKEFWDINKILEKEELKALKHATIFPDALRLFERFKGPIYIATLQPKTVVEKFLKRYGLLSKVKEIASRDKFGGKKKQLIYILEKVKVMPKQIAFVDDSKFNTEFANRLDMSAYLLKRKTPLKEKINQKMSNLKLKFLNRFLV